MAFCKIVMKSFPKLFTLPVIIAAYSGLIVLWYFFWLFLGDGYWWLVMLNRYAVYLFLPCLPLLFGVVLMRRSKHGLPLVIPAVILFLLYHPYLIPRPARAIGDSRSLRVMTYNVLFSNTDYDAVANVIKSYQPDLVALQEVQPGMMEALIDRLAGEYPYSLMGSGNDFGTTAVFSRSPLSDAYVLDLDVDRPAVIVKTTIKGQKVSFAAVHLLAYNLWWTKWKDIPATIMERTKNQNRQADIILREIKEAGGSVIVGCDCNSYETSSSYKILDETMENASRETGLALPFGNLPATRPDVSFDHIDYIWYLGDLNPIRVYKILDDGGSDHLPVLAIFEMN